MGKSSASSEQQLTAVDFELNAVWAAGFGLSLSLIVAIGAQNTFVLRQGLRREHVIAVVIVCVLLDALLMGAGIGGIASILGEHPFWLKAIGLAGAAVLLIYGCMALRRAFHPDSLRASTAGSSLGLKRVIGQALSISLLNPHVYLDTVVLVGSVGAQQTEGNRLLFWLGAASASALWFSGLGFGARILTPLFARPIAWRWLDMCVATIMLYLAWGLWQSHGLSFVEMGFSSP